MEIIQEENVVEEKIYCLLEHNETKVRSSGRHTYTATSNKKQFCMDSRSDRRSVLVSTVSDGKGSTFSNNNIKYGKSKNKFAIP